MSTTTVSNLLSLFNARTAFLNVFQSSMTSEYRLSALPPGSVKRCNTSPIWAVSEVLPIFFSPNSNQMYDAIFSNGLDRSVGSLNRISSFSLCGFFPSFFLRPPPLTFFNTAITSPLPSQQSEPMGTRPRSSPCTPDSRLPVARSTDPSCVSDLLPSSLLSYLSTWCMELPYRRPSWYSRDVVLRTKRTGRPFDRRRLGTTFDYIPNAVWPRSCLLYTSDAADERSSVDLGGRRIIKKKKKN